MTTIREKAPDIDGFARAWKLDLTNAKAAMRAKGKVDTDATISGWIVNAPWSHPLWPNVAIVCVHLRDIEGQSRPPTIYLEGATHEIMVVALNPDTEPEVDGEKLDYLSPTNFVGQFKATDEEAAAITEKIVRRICAGYLNPDTDAMRQWIALFGDHCLKSYYKRGIVGSINQGVPL